MNLSFESNDVLNARQRIKQLRQEIDTVMLSFRIARELHRVREATDLLRKRSELIHELIQAQKVLLELMEQEILAESGR